MDGGKGEDWWEVGVVVGEEGVDGGFEEFYGGCGVKGACEEGTTGEFVIEGFKLPRRKLGLLFGAVSGKEFGEGTDVGGFEFPDDAEELSRYVFAFDTAGDGVTETVDCGGDEWGVETT